jgi:acyl-CoA oxidase
MSLVKEMGSSSHLRGAETEAIYSHSTRTIRINSPTVTATKIWIGQAGQIATHCIVFANLRLEEGNKPCGIQLFIVQIRDQRTGQPMPGVEVGDMGPRV